MFLHAAFHQNRLRPKVTNPVSKSNVGVSCEAAVVLQSRTYHCASESYVFIFLGIARFAIKLPAGRPASYLYSRVPQRNPNWCAWGARRSRRVGASFVYVTKCKSKPCASLLPGRGARNRSAPQPLAYTADAMVMLWGTCGANVAETRCRSCARKDV